MTVFDMYDDSEVSSGYHEVDGDIDQLLHEDPFDEAAAWLAAQDVPSPY
jgi:hypothetical protein